MNRIGIIGTGRIAKRFLAEARRTKDIEVIGAYNPHSESLHRFCDENGLKGFSTPEELYSAVDAVYIATPHETHFAYAKNALESGKHVLCEKPMVLEEKQAIELFEIAAKRHLVLMEGIKTAYCPGFAKVLELAGSGVIGEVKYMDACFTKLEKEGVRELTDVSFGGSFRELGSYVLLPALKLFGCDYRDVTFDRVLSEKGIDLFTRGILRYSEGRFADLKCGLGVKGEGRLMISGTEGYILVDAPWWKTTHISVHYEDPSKVDVYECEFAGDGLRYELEEFNRRIEGSVIGRSSETPGTLFYSSEESITMAHVMEVFGRM